MLASPCRATSAWLGAGSSRKLIQAWAKAALWVWRVTAQMSSQASAPSFGMA